MVQNNKVLTVSYGTFSCTLEGFEDSFGTMQAIAEYFRDLAADDRYFGAEPPQPDAQMLAQIAQREVTRQVEARTSSEGIHLRAASPAAVQAEPVANDTIEAAPVEAAPVSTAVETPKAPVEDVPVEADVAPVEAPPVVGDAAEDVAEDLDLRTVDFFDSSEMEGEAKAELPAQESEDGTGAAETPAPSVDMDTIAAISAAVSEAPAEQIEETGSVELFEEGDAAEEDTPAADDAVDATAPQEVSTSHAPRSRASDSIAAKLQRIRAVVSQPAQDEFSEDEHAETFVEAVRSELSQDEAEPEAITEEAANEEDEISRVLDRLDLSDHLEEAPQEEDGIEAADENDSLFGDINDAIANVSEKRDRPLIDIAVEEAEAQEALAKAAAAKEQDAEEALPSRPSRGIRIARRKAREAEALAPETAEPADMPAESAAEKVGTQDEVKAQDDSVDEAETNSTSPHLRARIVKMKRSDLEKAMAAGQLEEVDEAEDPLPSEAFSSSLDEDEEADLLRELAEVEAELLASAQEQSAPQSDTSEDEPAPKGHSEPAAPVSEARGAPSSPDSDVSRLMAAAESKLEDPDNAKSRETYSHLRAAVAAAQADPAAKGNDATDAEPYREALASVVRPRRPEASAGGKAQRPRDAASRPAPLKLVAEQRVDPNVPAKPVRPRRVSTQEEEPAAAGMEGASSFADYAQERGAVELDELLEAAASYLSFVEGRDHFSRPQLMNKVRGLGLAEFNREDGLRFFGQLLREGKIERSENGRFAATDDIGFRPPKRAAS